MYFYCGFFFSDTQQPPTYPSTAMPYNTTAPQAGFTTPYPATTNNCPPQPHPVNNGIAPYPIDGTNPATMGIAQPPRIRQQLHNHGLVK